MVRPVDDYGLEVIRKGAQYNPGDDKYDHRINLENYVQLSKEIDNQLTKTNFQEIKTASRFSQIELKSAVNTVSNLSNNVIENGSATVTVGGTGEYKISTTALANDSAILESGERGRYIPGYDAEVGIGIRTDSSVEYTGEMHAEWGYFDDNDGFGFGKDIDGLYVFILRNGSKTKTYQSSWNADKLDGTGETGLNIDTDNGYIYQIEYAWYGYGVIRFFVGVIDDQFSSKQRPVLIHFINIEGSVSVQQPNLPIRVKLDNGTTATANNIFVGGRQFSIYGSPVQRFRITGERRSSTSVVTSAWRPIITLRRKTGIFSNQSVSILNLNAICDTQTIFSFVLDGTLTGASFGNITDFSPNETVLESDTSATAITGGDFFGGIYLAAGTNARSASIQIEEQEFDFVARKPVTLVARAVGTNGTVELASLNAKEQW